MPISIDVVEVDDWVGDDGDTAVSTLEAQGVEVVRNNVLSSTIASGVVISQLVEATPFGTRVTLEVSSGRSIGGSGGTSCSFILFDMR